MERVLNGRHGSVVTGVPSRRAFARGIAGNCFRSSGPLSCQLGNVRRGCRNAEGRKSTLRIQSEGASGETFSVHSEGLVSTEGVGGSETSQPSRVTIYYATGWDRAVLHHSASGGRWKDLQFRKIGSSRRWVVVDVEVPENGQNGSTSLLEFVLTNNDGQWDKPLDGNNYVVDAPGVYALARGVLSRSTGAPVMVVSDLDGTMVGDDSATSAFKAFWEDEAVIRGSMLVYNTGRNLQSFQRLMEEKGRCLAVPDVLITAVGTKIYINNDGNWVEDKSWAQTLDKGWKLDAVRNAAYSALAAVGKDNMHFRPPEEQNDHKITCGVKNSELQTVVKHIEQILEKENVTANLIYSGDGDWRFLDIVSQTAGKLESLDYVRQKYRFPLTSTVACGDSGNDILMLSGENLAIVVGNAQPDLKLWCSENGNGSKSSRLWMASKHEAYGILEGLNHFGFS